MIYRRLDFDQLLFVEMRDTMIFVTRDEFETVVWVTTVTCYPF